MLGALCSSSVLPSELPKPILTDPSEAWESAWLASEPTLYLLCCLIDSLCYFGESSERLAPRGLGGIL